MYICNPIKGSAYFQVNHLDKVLLSLINQLHIIETQLYTRLVLLKQFYQHFKLWLNNTRQLLQSSGKGLNSRDVDKPDTSNPEELTQLQVCTYVCISCQYVCTWLGLWKSTMWVQQLYLVGFSWISSVLKGIFVFCKLWKTPIKFCIDGKFFYYFLNRIYNYDKAKLRKLHNFYVTTWLMFVDSVTYNNGLTFLCTFGMVWQMSDPNCDTTV